MKMRKKFFFFKLRVPELLVAEKYQKLLSYGGGGVTPWSLAHVWRRLRTYLCMNHCCFITLKILLVGIAKNVYTPEAKRRNKEFFSMV